LKLKKYKKMILKAFNRFFILSLAGSSVLYAPVGARLQRVAAADKNRSPSCRWREIFFVAGLLLPRWRAFATRCRS
jgi:hypothetical protein